jgi:hypothetical protein
MKLVFVVFTVVTGINIVFLFVTLCSLAEAQSFGGNCATYRRKYQVTPEIWPLPDRAKCHPETQ